MINTILKNIIYTGLSEETEEGLKRTIKLLNIVTLVTMGFGIMYVIISYLINETTFAAILTCYTVLISFVFFLNKLRHFTASRIFFLTLVNIGLASNSLYFGQESGIHYFYFVTASLSFIFFSAEEYKNLLLSVISSGCFFLVLQFDFLAPIILLENEKLKIIFHLSLISSFTWTLYNFYYISKKNNDAVVKINKQNRIIKYTLKQKEILLQEVHHRVKNNLQIVVSLINLQSNKIENEDIKVIFNENARRIRSIATVHELLYSTKDFTKVSAKDYVEQLIEGIKASQTNPNLSATINYEIEDVKISLDKAIPLGLIVNEIITNSLKHSAIQNKVQINVNIQKIKNKIEVEAHDNGKGFDYDKELNDDKSIGLFLITELTNQIDGVLSSDIGERGTKYHISFND